MARITRKQLSALAQNLLDHVTFGNSKLPKSTMIFNMGPAATCPSRQRGLCQCPDKCYADKAERMYPTCLPYRERQAAIWLDHSENELAAAFAEIVAWKNQNKKQVNKLRFNESGDFYGQECVKKLNTIAGALLDLGVRTYGYSARQDLDFHNTCFTVRGSGFDMFGLQFKAVKEASGTNFVCPGDCKKCSACLYSTPVIECILH